jgi:hypothetical protein
MANGRAGRPRKYGTAAALRKGIEAYWDSVSYQEPMMIAVPTGELDEDGNDKMVLRALTDGAGSYRMVTKFLEPPSEAGLCLFLGISKQTWAAYAADEALGEVCAWFKQRVEGYLLAQLNSEKRKSVHGIIFNLKNNYGYTDKVEHSGAAAVKIEMDKDVEGLAE